MTPHRAAALKGRLDAMRMLPTLLRDRRAIQAKVDTDLNELERLMLEHKLTRWF